VCGVIVLRIGKNGRRAFQNRDQSFGNIRRVGRGAIKNKTLALRHGTPFFMHAAPKKGRSVFLRSPDGSHIQERENMEIKLLEISMAQRE